MPCAGAADEFCGASVRLTMYQKNGFDPAAPGQEVGDYQPQGW